MVIETMAISSAYQTYLNTVALQLGVPLMVVTTAIALVAIWTLVWKAVALWKSARKNQPIWFILLLVINTLGILEILYIFIFSKMGRKQAKAEVKPLKKNKKQ